MIEDSSTQRITRLTALSEILTLIDERVTPVKPQKSKLDNALGFVLAEDIFASEQPPHTIALHDGYAVEAGAFGDAGPYMPVPLPSTARRIDAGEALPNGCDAVLPVDAVALRSGRIEAVAAVAPAQGVLAAGDDATPRMPLRRAGERVRALDVAVMRAARIKELAVRAPRISVVLGASTDSPILDAACTALKRAVAGAGGIVFGQPGNLVAALDYEPSDAIVAIGGTGSGKRDGSVRTLAKYGHVEAHGIAVSPGQTAAFGFFGTRPVLLVPGRLDAALAVWLLIGRRLLARLAGGEVEDFSATLPLERKITSTIGLTELFPVTCAGRMAQPLAAGYLSFTALTRSDGWILVPAGSEGFPAGTPVAVNRWP